MSDLVVHYFTGLCCDKCGERRDTPELLRPWSQEAAQFREAAWADGWSRWSSRSVRDYCPRCVPGRGHAMRRLK